MPGYAVAVKVSLPVAMIDKLTDLHFVQLAQALRENLPLILELQQLNKTLLLIWVPDGSELTIGTEVLIYLNTTSLSKEGYLLDCCYRAIRLYLQGQEIR